MLSPLKCNIQTYVYTNVSYTQQHITHYKHKLYFVVYDFEHVFGFQCVNVA